MDFLNNHIIADIISLMVELERSVLEGWNEGNQFIACKTGGARLPKDPGLK